jgi:hypothetical protein
MTMRKFLVVGCLVAASMLRPSIAAADTLTYAGLGSGQWVNLQMGSTSETGWAGEILWNLTANGVTKAITTYCADLFDDAKYTQTGVYETTAALDLTPSISHGAGAHAGSTAAYLVNSYAGGAHGNNLQAAALQLAIWQDLFGTSSFTVLNTTANYPTLMGAISSFTLPAGSFTASAGYFDVANGAAIGSGANGQDQVVVGTPEPSTILLLAFAMGLMVTYQLRLKPQPQRQRNV